MELFTSIYWPFFVLLVAMISVGVMIYKFKIHPFVALILSSIIIGLISPSLAGDKGTSRLISAVELPMTEFGIMAGKISWVIALAALIGFAMMESGAANSIVDKMIIIFGESKAALALLVCGFILSIPVFFDTVFFLLIPLAISLAIKTGKNFVLYVIAIIAGAIVTHSIVPPTPGPLIMAETLDIDLGVTILAGLIFGIVPAAAALGVGHMMNAKLNIPVRVFVPDNQDNQSAPSFFASLLPVIVPILLISVVSILNITMGEFPEWIGFLGNKNIAMTLGAFIAMYLWAKSADLNIEKLWKASSKPLEIAGVIILITSAGGAFGAMIKNSGIGHSIEQVTSGISISFLLLGWIISAVMKTAQGSSTVAMITSASIMYSIVGTGEDLPYHPIYLLLSIGFGVGCVSWMNDSGFWVVSRMSGFTEKETFQTWSLIFAVIGVVGLVQVLIFSAVLPMR